MENTEQPKTAPATSAIVHPSFAAAEACTCSKCHYFSGGKSEELAKCAHPEHGGHVDPVFGYLRSNTKARDMRADGAACGPEGRLFVRYQPER